MRGETERKHAEAARMYRPSAFLEGGRRRLAAYARTAAARAKLPMDSGAIRLLEDPAVPVIEFAHNGQLPHLGVVRCALKAAELAESIGGVCLYAFGNHYTMAMWPGDLYLGIPFEGRPPEAMKRPLSVSVGKAQADIPFNHLRPPTGAVLGDLAARTAERVEANVRHERKQGQKVLDVERVLRRMGGSFAMLERAALETTTFGDWLLRVQAELLAGNPLAGRLVLFPMGEVHLALSEELRGLARREPELLAVKAEVARAQEAAGEKPFGTSAESSGWIACPGCLRRSRASRITAEGVEHACPACGRKSQASWTEVGIRFAPDIVLLELLLLQAGVRGWVLGSEASYVAVIAEAHQRLLRGPMPPTFPLRSVPTFRGIGDPPEGYGKTRLLRALFEMEPGPLFEALLAPWEESPAIRSPHLG